MITKPARVILVTLLGLLISLTLVAHSLAQTPVTTDKLPPPPPVPKLKPTPTPRPPRDDEIDIVRVTSNLVMVPVSVTDSSGQPMSGLTASDFRLEEQGRSQEIAQMGDPEQVPLDIALLLDVSGSVEARFDFERESAARSSNKFSKPETGRPCMQSIRNHDLCRAWILLRGRPAGLCRLTRLRMRLRSMTR